MAISIIEGGVCAPIGFLASGVNAGIGKGEKNDLSLIYSKRLGNAAAVYTTNKVKGAPITVTKDNLTNGRAQAIICNSGYANTCSPNGLDIAKQTCVLLSQQLKIAKSNVIVASTGVIGQPLSIEPFETSMAELVSSLSPNGNKAAAEGIMTTDRKIKEIAVSFEIDGTVCHIGAIAKGSGMIHPNMATMLAFITTDCDISADMLQAALSTDVKSTFNMLSIDGNTSTNDMVCIIANGMAKNKTITKNGKSYSEFAKALNTITTKTIHVIYR